MYYLFIILMKTFYAVLEILISSIVAPWLLFTQILMLILTWTNETSILSWKEEIISAKVITMEM